MRIIYIRKSMKILYTVVLIAVFCSIAAGISSDASFVYLEGLASWYSEFSAGIKPTTANMEMFDHDKATCAIWGLPFDTRIEVTNLSNDRKVIVRVNDRGPAKQLCQEGRVIDLTMAAFEEIEVLEKGLIKVKIRVVE